MLEVGVFLPFVKVVCFDATFISVLPRRRRSSIGQRIVQSFSDLHSLNTSAKMFDFFLPPPPCLHLELFYYTKFPQPPLLCPLFHDPPSPSDADITSGRSLKAMSVSPSLPGEKGVCFKMSVARPAQGGERTNCFRQCFGRSHNSDPTI